MSPLLTPSALAPFRVRNFRLQWPADLLTSCAFEMETLILGWYILVETGSVLLLTLFGALQYVGTLVAPMFGVVGDRVGHRNLLCGMRAIYTGLATTLMSTAFAGELTPFYVFIIAGTMGLVRPSDLGVRSALIADNMPADQLMGAMGLSRATQDVARSAGALAGAGLFVMFGMGPAYVVVVSFYALGLLLTMGIRVVRSEPERADAASVELPRPSAWRDLREGLAYVWSTPRLLAAMWLAFLVNLSAYPMSNGLLPYVAKDIYRLDQTGLGYLVASFAVGSLLGSAVVSLRSGMRPARMMIISAVAWYAALLAFAQMETPFGGVLMLMLAGFAQSVCMITLAVLLLRTASAKFRGRVMGVRMLVIYGLLLGLPAAGALVDLVGFNATATTYAAVGLFFTLVIAVRWRAALWRSDSPANAR